MLIEVEVGEWLQSLNPRARQPCPPGRSRATSHPPTPHLHTHGKAELISKRERNGAEPNQPDYSSQFQEQDGRRGRASGAELRENPCS